MPKKAFKYIKKMVVTSKSGKKYTKYVYPKRGGKADFERRKVRSNIRQSDERVRREIASRKAFDKGSEGRRKIIKNVFRPFSF